MKKFIVIILTVLSVSRAISREYVYEFGKNIGDIIYTSNGRITLTWTTDVVMPIPINLEVMYVKVTVSAVSSPKVDYDSFRRTVRIAYSWTQVPTSSYQILVKGLHIRKED